MSEEIIKVLDYITDKLGVAIDWSTENALPYIEEILGKYATYNIVTSAIGVALGLLVIPTLIIFYKIVRESKIKCEKTKECTAFYYYNPLIKEAEFDIFPLMLMITCYVLLGVFGILAIALNAGDLIKWSIVPEIALLEEIQALIG